MNLFSHKFYRLLTVVLLFGLSWAMNAQSNDYYSVKTKLDSLISTNQYDQAVDLTYSIQPADEITSLLLIMQRNRALLRQRKPNEYIPEECQQANRALRNQDDSLSIYLSARFDELLGHYYYQRSNLFIGLSYLDSAAHHYGQLRDYASNIYNLNMIGTIYYLNGEKAKSARYYQQALSLFESHPVDSSYYFELLQDLGNLHGSLDQLQRAEEMYLRVYRDPIAKNYPSIMADIHTNLGNIAQQRGNISTATYYYTKAIDLYKDLSDSADMAVVYHNLGILVEDSAIGLALDYLNKSLYIKKLYDDRSGMALTYNELARVYFLIDDINRSEEYAHLAKEMAESVADVNNFSEAYNTLSKIAAKRGQYQQAYQFNIRYHKIADSIQLLDQQETIDKIEQIYDIEKQQRIIADLENAEVEKQAQLRKSKVINYALGGATILLIVVLILLMSNFQQMQRAKNSLYTKNLEITAAEALVKGQEEERQRLAHELHDKVGNHITILKNYVTAKGEIDENLLNIVQDMSAEVRNISQDLMPPVLERFGLGDALEELCTRYRDQMQATIDLNLDQGESLPLKAEDQITLYRLVQEIIQVSLLQYNANYLLIDMKWGDDGISVHLEDNGVRKKRISEGESLLHPWQTIEHRVQFLKGTFRRSNHNQGNEYEIYIPHQKG